MAAESDAVAVARCRARAKAGEEDAVYVLGATLLRGLRGKGAKPLTGAKMLRKLVDAGDEANAAPSYFIGAAYHAMATAKRERLLDEPGGIARLLRRAAECGHVRALCELAVMHEDGVEVQKNGREAVRLLDLAAKADFLDAKRALARMHIDGQHVPRDPEKAARLLGLDRTADLWKDGKGPRPPPFLFTAARPDAEGPGRGTSRGEYNDEEIDEFLNTDT